MTLGKYFTMHHLDIIKGALFEKVADKEPSKEMNEIFEIIERQKTILYNEFETALKLSKKVHNGDIEDLRAISKRMSTNDGKVVALLYNILDEMSESALRRQGFSESIIQTLQAFNSMKKAKKEINNEL